MARCAAAPSVGGVVQGYGDPPRAGCPRQNLRRTVADLVEGAGLSVVRVRV